MNGDETLLKQQIKNEKLAPLYFLYGEETYLTLHYTAALAKAAVGDDEMGDFNLVKLDGQETDFDQIEDAAFSLPLMADRKCIIVRDFDPTAASAAVQKRLTALLEEPPESCVLIFRMTQLQPDMKKSAKWRHFAEAVSAHGVCVEFARKSDAEAARLLTSGAARRHVNLSHELARTLVEQCGNDLSSLLGELDKLCAIAGEGGTITAELIESAATRHLEASIYDLSKAILRHNYTDSYTILSRLLGAREDPIIILARLSGAYTDLYRAKVADAAGVPATSLTAEFGYKGREFVLRNAARDCRSLSRDTLRRSLDLLAETDIRLKSSRCDKRVALEQVIARLILLAKEEKRL